MSLTPDLGYCGLDRDRRPLTGRELRGCWTQRPAGAASTGLPIVGAPPVAVHRLRRSSGVGEGRGAARDFVPVEDQPPTERSPVSPESPPGAAADAPVELPLVLLEPAEGWEARTSLFGELER